MIPRFLKLYSPKVFMKQFMPLLAEQSMSVLVGIIGMLMVGYAGDVALSAVGIVNTMNTVILATFSALSSGATAVISQLLGAKKPKEAGKCATQFITVSVVLSFAVCVIMLIFAKPLLYTLYGSSEQDVLDAAYIYLIAVSISIPFLVIFTSICAIFRACKDYKMPMYVSLIVNVINAVVCAFTIYYMKIGIYGASIGMLAARVVGAVIIVIKMFSPRFMLELSKKINVEWNVIKPIMHIGLPMGLDSMIFQAGKLLVTIFMSGMGTITMAAYSVASNLCTLLEIPGNAMLLLEVTLVGRSIGAGKDDRAKDEMLFTTIVNCLWFLIFSIPVYIFLQPLTSLFSSTLEVQDLAMSLIKISIFTGILLWSPAFVLPFGLRSAGDVTFTIVCSCASLWAIRIVLSWLLGVYLGYGVVGIWWAMICDWVVRGGLFMYRLLSGKWKGRAEIRAEN